MPDHKPVQKRTIACDFDGTLARYDGWKGPDKLGDPVPEMVKKVKEAIAQGAEVWIFTARVNPKSHSWQSGVEANQALYAIADWCRKHIGIELPITHEKMLEFTELWDDRAKEVLPNTGVFLAELIEATK